MPKTVADVLGLVTFVGICLALWLARRRNTQRNNAAMAAVHMEGFEAGKAAVLAHIGTTVVVNQQQGVSGSTDHGTGAVLDLAAAAADLGPGHGGDPRVYLGAPVGLPARGELGDSRAARAQAIDAAPNARRIVGRVP